MTCNFTRNLAGKLSVRLIYKICETVCRSLRQMLNRCSERTLFRCRKKIASVFAMLFVFPFCAICQESFEFVDKDISEILYSVSVFKQIPISPDDTVSGNADFRCTGIDFEEMFDAFLRKNRLYVEKKPSRWTVSRIRIESSVSDSAEKSYNLDACDVTVMQLFEKAALATGICVTYDQLPEKKVSLHTGFCPAEELMKRISGLCFGYELLDGQNGVVHISKCNSASSGINANNGARIDFRQDEQGQWSCDVQNSLLSFAAERLFSEAGKDFCFALSNDQKILRSHFTAESFDEALKILCLQGGADFTTVNGLYLLTPAKNRNKINEAGKAWQVGNLKYLRTSQFILLSGKRFPEVETILINENGSFLFLADDRIMQDYLDFIELTDVNLKTYLVQLKFLQTKEFLENLPPFIDKSMISDSGRGDSFFFTGTQEAYENLIEKLPLFDRPVARVRYDLLIMQYQSTDGSKFSQNLKVGKLSPGDMNIAAFQIGSVLDFNVNVVAAFGLKFALALQAAISESKAKVYADTTLNGVSGSSINFQCTNTYRYRDNNLDPETGEPIYSGVTKEIISGLKLEVTGTVTGDGMITSKITASVSRQGTDLSTTTGNPPPTSEKVVTTEVRAKSGEPVILSGLVQNEESENVSRTPFVSRVPLLGNLFKAKEKSAEKVELVIYLVPSSEQWNPDEKTQEDIKKERRSHFKKILEEICEKNI